MTLAVANYHEEHGKYPPAYIVGPDGRPWHSWRILILPYLEQSELFAAYDFSEPWDGPNNRKLAVRMPTVYGFHGMERPGNHTVTNYLAVVGERTAWPSPKSVSLSDVRDAPGMTIHMVENHGANVNWMEPRDLVLAAMDFRFNSPHGISSQYDEPAVAMLDASIHRLAIDIKPETLRAMLTIRGGEEIEPTGAGGWHLLPDGRLRPLRQER